MDYNITVRATQDNGYFADKTLTFTALNTQVDNFIVCGTSNSYRSIDGYNWTPMGIGLKNAAFSDSTHGWLMSNVAGNTLYAGVDASSLTTINPTVVSGAAAAGPAPWFTKIYWDADNSIWVSAGIGSNLFLYTSTDKQTWTCIGKSTDFSLSYCQGLVRFAGTYFVLTTQGLYKLNGSTLTLISAVTVQANSYWCYTLKVINGQLVVYAPDSANNSAATVWTSLDGTTFAKFATGVSGTAGGMVYANGYINFLGISTAGNYPYQGVSTDLKTFTAVTGPISGGYGQCLAQNGLVYNNGVFLSAGIFNSTDVWYTQTSSSQASFLNGGTTLWSVGTGKTGGVNALAVRSKY
jgi:hypothetical protein